MVKALEPNTIKLSPPLHCQIPGCNLEANVPVTAPVLCRYHRGTYQADVKFSPLLFWAVIWSMAYHMKQVADLETWGPVELDEYLMAEGLPSFVKLCDVNKLSHPEFMWLTTRFMKKTHARIRQFTLSTYLRAAGDLAGTVPLIGVDGNVRKTYRLNVTMRWVEEQIIRLEPVYPANRKVVAITGVWHPIRPKALPESESAG